MTDLLPLSKREKASLKFSTISIEYAMAKGMQKKGDGVKQRKREEEKRGKWKGEKSLFLLLLSCYSRGRGDTA
jgi:hypothetical protein